MLITTGGVLIRTRVSEIRELGRATQGVTLINLSEEGLIEIDKAEVKLENLSEIIQRKLINTKNKKIVISTLNETKINNLIIVVDMIRSVGIENIALITKEK